MESWTSQVNKMSNKQLGWWEKTLAKNLKAGGVNKYRLEVVRKTMKEILAFEEA